MMEAWATLFNLAQQWLAVGLSVFLRIGACFLVLPGLGEQLIPVRVRLGAALACTALVSPLVIHVVPVASGSFPPMIAFGSEALSGLLLGLALRFSVQALQIAGSIAAQATSLSQIMGGASPDPQPAMGAILMLGGIALALLSGFHVHLVAAFVRSYEALPFGVFPLTSDVGRWGVRQVAACFGFALSLSAPFLLASLLYNVALGVINKAMPQLMVAFVGAPAITWGGLVLLLICVPFILPFWLQGFQGSLTAPFGPP